MDALLVITNVPDREVAKIIANELVERRLAACVNVLSDCDSVYRWEGRLETACEVPLLIKTCEMAYPDVEAAIRKLHPSELPEIIAVRIERGLPEYLQWVAAQTLKEIG